MNVNLGVHMDRLARSRAKGSLEYAAPGWRIWKAGAGYMAKGGGFTKHLNKALLVDGPGEAIRLAAVHGFAITSW